MNILLLINKYKMQRRSLDDENELIETYSPLVRKIAYSIHRGPPSGTTIEVSDLIISGEIGLILANRNYNSLAGASFETYARIRIRGEMIDELRKYSFVPRESPKNNRLFEETRAKLVLEFKREITDREVAEELRKRLGEKADKIITDHTLAEAIHLTESFDEETSNVCNNSEGQFEQRLRVEIIRHVQKTINDLPERKKRIIRLYHRDKLTLREIGDHFNVSGQRICQLLSETYASLREKLPIEYLFDLSSP